MIPSSIRYISLFLSIFLWACATEPKEPTASPSDDKAQQVVDQAIATHGGLIFQDCSFSFRFRDKTYSWQRKGDVFRYTRSFTDSLGQITDILSNKGFQRLINGKAVDISHEQDSMYSNSLNSVLYFVQLPYGLNDPAVNKEYLGQETILGKDYDKVRVTFRAEGGGQDFEDEFVYWFHASHHSLDYLAYSYQTDGGGLRFRKAFNVRTIGGVRFQDYINYKAEVLPGRAPAQMGQLFQDKSLDSLSSILNEDIQFTGKNSSR